MQGYLGRPWTVGGSVFISWMAFPQLSFLFSGRFPDRARLLAVRSGGRRDLPHHHRTEGVFVVQGWRGDMAVWPGMVGADRDHDGVAAVAGHHHGDRRGDAQLRELAQMRVWGAGNVRFGGVDPRGADERCLWFLTPEVANAAYAEQAEHMSAIFTQDGRFSGVQRGS